MPYPIKARLTLRGLSKTANAILQNLASRGANAVSDAASDFVGDNVAEGIGGTAGGIIGGEIGERVGDAVGDFASSALNKDDDLGYFDGPAKILKRTGGLVFPNTPLISVAHIANWEDYDLPHTNYQYWAYKNSKIGDIRVDADFTANTRGDADYLLGALHFLRSVTKMHFGINDDNAGVPPPVLEFTAMGSRAFNKVPVIVTDFNNTFEREYDYVASSPATSFSTVQDEGLSLDSVLEDLSSNINAITFVPVHTIFSITLKPYYTPSSMAEDFTLADFKNGKLLDDGFI